jgi:hypothetical protein
MLAVEKVVGALSHITASNPGVTINVLSGITFTVAPSIKVSAVQPLLAMRE